MHEGLDINEEDGNGATCLHYAAKSNTKEMVQFLVYEGLDSKAKDRNGATCLHYAAEGNTQAIAAFLIDDQGLDSNARDNDGLRCLEWAKQCNPQDMIQFLVDKCIVVNAKNISCISDKCDLYQALKKADKDVAKSFFKDSLAINDSDYGVTFFDWAVSEKDKGMVQFLLESGAIIHRSPLLYRDQLLFSP